VARQSASTTQVQRPKQEATREEAIEEVEGRGADEHREEKQATINPTHGQWPV
jgi:hypothetical protein